MLASWYEELAASAPETNKQPGQSRSGWKRTLAVAKGVGHANSQTYVDSLPPTV